MTADHVDQEVLFGYLERAASAEANAQIESHLAGCADCARLLASVQEFFSALDAREVWSADEIELPRAPVDGRRIEAAIEAARRANEGAAASQPILATILEGPIESWRVRCAAAPELRAPAAIQALLARSRDARETRPAAALELARIAIDLASTLDASDASTRLKGLAWKEAANAYRYLSRYGEALDAVERAESFFRRMIVSEFDLGAVEYVRGQMLRELDRIPEALVCAHRSRELAILFGDVRRIALASLLEGSCFASSGDWSLAREKYLSVINPVRELGDAQLLAALFHNVGTCCRELGEREAAATYYLQAMTLFRELGMTVESNRMRWNVGRMLLAEGKLAEAIDRFEQVRSDFARLEMKSEVGLISLDLAEALLLAGRPSHASALCRDAIDLFQKLGVTRPALMALAYLDEALRAEPPSPKAVRYVREYLEELPRRENLRFAPPAN